MTQWWLKGPRARPEEVAARLYVCGWFPEEGAWHVAHLYQHFSEAGMRTMRGFQHRTGWRGDNESLRGAPDESKLPTPYSAVALKPNLHMMRVLCNCISAVMRFDTVKLRRKKNKKCSGATRNTTKLCQRSWRNSVVWRSGAGLLWHQTRGPLEKQIKSGNQRRGSAQMKNK